MNTPHSAAAKEKISQSRQGKCTGDKNPKWVPKVAKNCEHCGVGMLVRPYLLSRGSGKYCSKRCQSSSKIGKPSKKPGGLSVVCAECGKEFKTQAARVESGRGKFCSRKCLGTYHAKTDPNFVKRGVKRPEMSGNKHPAWKGGVTEECQSIRTSLEYKVWRKAVLERDFYSCTACGSKDRLHAHHILRFIDFPHKRFDISNGITLCLTCHWKLHGKNERRKK